MSDIRILLLEDSAEDRELITRELKRLGWEHVRSESTRDDFIRALSTFKPSIVLADYSLGGFDADQALKLVREHNTDLPFIVIAGTLEEEVAANILRAGADDYLLKDRLARLGPAINHALLVRELRDKREKASQELLESEERYNVLFKRLADRENLLRRIFDAEPECVKLLDEDGRLLEINHAGLEMLEVPSIEDIRHRQVYRFVVPEYRDRFKEGVRRVFQGESLRVQFEILGLKGTRRWMDTNAVPLRDDTGQITGLLAITRDVTKSKELEEQFRQSQKLEAVGRLAGGIAHDFNNILTIISGYANLTLDIRSIATEVRKNLMSIQHGVSRAADLTRQLLAFSRKQLLQPRVLDPNKLIGSLSSLVNRVIGEDVRLGLKLGSGIGNIKADPNQVEQVIMNLAVNARDAMPDGGALSIETNGIQLSARLEQNGFRIEPGNYMRLSIVDSGTGMTDEVLSHVFEPFYTTKELGKGTGLGLSTVYGIVRQSGGAITVQSADGAGTRFDVYFPITDEPITTPPPAEASSNRGSERVMVVEDDRELGELVRNMLTCQGYTVTLAESGAAAIRLLESGLGVDLILTDIVMPGMSGLALGKQIQDRGLAVKIIYMTGYTEDFLAERGNREIPETFHVIEKPFTPQNLGRTVRQVLDTFPAA